MVKSRVLLAKNSYIERRLNVMWISSLPKRGIYEVSFGYHSKLDGYTNQVRISHAKQNRLGETK